MPNASSRPASQPASQPKAQLALFELPASFDTAKPAPLATLPFQQSEQINAARVAHILRVSKGTVYWMLERKLLRGYFLTGTDNGSKERRIWRVEYTSVVEYCDRLHVVNGIKPRRTGPLNVRGRRRDADLLPFPAGEETTVATVARRLDCTHESVLKLIESGHLAAYQVLVGTKGSPWRIHAPSVEAYIRSLCDQAARPIRRG